MHSRGIMVLLASAGLLVLACAGRITAAERMPFLHALFSDHMVLQRDISAPIWGWSTPGAKIVVQMADHHAEAIVDASGRWQTTLGPLPAGGPFTLSVNGPDSVTVHDVLIGEVWIYAGQSNMNFPVQDVTNAVNEIANSDHPTIHIYQTDATVDDAPKSSTAGRWSVSGPSTISGQSAVAYFFARQLQQSLKVPIGMIGRAIGSSSAEAWTDANALRTDSDLQPIAERCDNRILDWAKAVHHIADLSEPWLTQTQQALAAGRPRPPLPSISVPPGLMWDSYMAGGMYNGMIAPLAPYGVRGAIWYQGEANTPRGWQYRKLLPALISGWRRHWNQGEFPFLYVQLPNNGPEVSANVQPENSEWAELRESQLAVLRSVPAVGMAITIDIGESNNIHPHNKQDVGQRLALVARTLAYHEKVVAYGPLFASASSTADHMVVRFLPANAALAVHGIGALHGFSLAGADHVFHWAKATIVGDTVEVSCAQTPQPLAVRYAWADNPEGCNLMNTEGLPASPFRSDTWPGITDAKR